MDKTFETEYWVPEHVREYLRSLGFVLPLGAMEGYIRMWHEWMQSVGSFYDYRDTDGFGRIYEVHRRSIHPAMRVCQEWGSLLLNDKTSVVCENQAATEWLDDFFTKTGFMPQAQNTVVRAFGMGTGAWALWIDADARKVRIRHYDARMVIPLTWDEEGVSECAFVTRAFYRGKAVDQLQMHLRGGLGLDGNFSSPSQPESPDASSPSESSLSHGNAAPPSQSFPSQNCEGTYRIVTAIFDEAGNLVEPSGVCAEYDTGSTFPTFALVKPAVDNTRVDMSPYGQSVFADAIDAIQAVDLAFDALISEIDAGKMRIFLSDVMFDRDDDGTKKRRTPIPFGKQDCAVFRKVMSTEDMISDFAPALRTSSQAEAFRIALQMLGDLTGFGITYFDFDNTGYVKTATEVASDSSALMRNIARHEHALEVSLAGISHALLHCERALGEGVPEEGEISVSFDDSIVTDTAAEKRIAMAEVGVTMHPWEYRARFYGEDEATARARAEGLGARTRPDEPKTYRWVDSRKRFDAIGAPNWLAEYPITLRVVRRRLPRGDGDGNGGDRWLNLVTNLPEGECPARWLVRTYGRRWDHEVGFRRLKKAVGMEDPRTRDLERAGMEAWGRPILHNACSLGARGALARRLRGTGHRQARDLTTAYKGMLRIIRGADVDLAAVCARHTHVVEGGRHFERRARNRSPARRGYRH